MQLLQYFCLYRFIATTSVQCKTVQNTEKNPAAQTENHSFVMHLFRGQLESRQVFPYPDVLTDEQRDTLKMLVDPVSKFFEVRIFLKSDKICLRFGHLSVIYAKHDVRVIGSE
jgi:hypothetical protein